ncbi:MAG: hypothetical protein MUF35_00710 [Candidatus Nanopelagicales bacterium]|jgi:hypothetical protein|nr:hypothetical protein [Candidatus Nanopelagicales bacterium]
MGEAERGPGSDGQPGRYDWPVEAGVEEPRPGVITLVVQYVPPFLLLLLFPTIAWIALLPLALVVRRTAHPAHQRPAFWVYLITGGISVAPWLAMLLD